MRRHKRLPRHGQHADQQNLRLSHGSTFRPDLEGLRAVAVLLVIADHVFEWPAGGFIGVDVFFVLSGFLITSLLLKEHHRTGSISFRDFYLRRVRRIVPAAALVIVVTALASSLVFVGARVQQTLTDGVWAALFSANWRFVIVGQDYFAQDRAVSPFQHYWSLAVEEQFYFAWPLLIFLVLLVSRRRPLSSPITELTAVLAVVTISSFSWACYQSLTAPTPAYFSTLTRAWELSAGGLLAVLVPLLLPRRPPIALTMSFLGLALLLGAGIALSPDLPFPGPWGVLPVFGVSLVILGGVGAQDRALNPVLCHPAVRYIGRVSFSLYLWHWPVVVLLAAFLPEQSWPYLISALGLTTVLSILSFHLVEDPIRKSTWLAGRAHRRRRHSSRVPLTSGRQTGGLSALALLTVVLGWLALTSVAPMTTDTTLPASSATLASGDKETGSSGPPLAQQVQMAIEEREWPDFDVPLEDLESAKAAEWTSDECIDVGEADLQRCTYDAPGDKLAVVLGDSVAISWLPGVRAALADRGYETLSLTMGQCPASYATVDSNDERQGFGQACNRYQAWAAGVINEYDPDLVIASSAENSIERLASGSAGGQAEQEWSADTLKLLQSVASADRTMVILSPPPQGKKLQGCITRFNGPSDCTSEISEAWATQSTAEQAAVERFAEPDQVAYVDTSAWFCNSSGVCPTHVGETPVRADGNHLTDAYARFVAPQLERVLMKERPDAR